MSKVVDDLDNKLKLFPEFIPIAEMNAVITHARSLEAMLRKHNTDIDGDCVECGRYFKFGHSPDCELARLLG